MECFIIQSNELESRLDPFYYKPEFRIFSNKISHGKIEVKEIQEISKVICGPFGSSITTKDYRAEGVPLIRISNINDDRLSIEEIVCISKELSEKLKSYIVKNGDLVISQRGTLGLVVKIDDAFDGAVISANFIAIKNLKKLFPDFLQIILSSKFGQIQLLRKTSGQVQTKITTDDIKMIKVPIFSEKIQNQIIDKIKQAYQEKIKIEAEAQKLLDSINDYVLDELGIKLPELNDKMVYVVNSEEVQNKRADAYYYQPKFEEVEKAIKKGKFEVKDLQQITELLINGIDFRDFVDDGVMYLRVSNIKPNCFDLSDVMFVPNMDITKDIKLKEGDVLVTRKGTYGIATVADKESEKHLISSEIFRIVLKEGLNPFYLSSWLNSSCLQIIFNRIKTGGIMGHLSQEALLKIEIPFPPLAVQNKIAKEIKKRMKKAEQLQKEAKEELEKAKQEVEKIILGADR